MLYLNIIQGILQGLKTHTNTIGHGKNLYKQQLQAIEK